MTDKQEVKAFFDSWAPKWDAGMVRNEEVISTILDNAGVAEGKRVLDVGCGTGVLIPDYLARNVFSVTGVDISCKMTDIAAAKFADPRVKVLCADAETEDIGRDYDCIVIYNAFPHFSDQEGLISRLAGLLAPGGILTVAHGMSRERLAAHHRGTPDSVSNGLMTAEELAEIFSGSLKVTTIISDDKMYQVAGRK